MRSHVSGGRRRLRRSDDDRFQRRERDRDRIGNAERQEVRLGIRAQHAKRQRDEPGALRPRRVGLRIRRAPAASRSAAANSSARANRSAGFFGHRPAQHAIDLLDLRSSLVSAAGSM